MKQIPYCRRVMRILLILALMAGMPWETADSEESAGGDRDQASSSLSADIAGTDARPARDDTPYYEDWLADLEKNGVPAAAGNAVSAPGAAVSSGEAAARLLQYEGREALVWSSGKGWIEWTVNVPEEGRYELALDYYPLPEAEGGKRQPMEYGVTINGKTPFKEARAVRLHRSFRDDWPLRTDGDGNQLRPEAEETAGWRSASLRDAEGAAALPLQWHFPRGTSVVRLETRGDPAAIANLRLAPPVALAAYEEVRAAYPNAESAGAAGPIVVEAERMSEKNVPYIQIQYNRSALTTPMNYNRMTFNTVGGGSWMKGGQSASWTFDVPEDGRYKIALRSVQDANTNLAVFRNVYVDGRIPFRELAAYKLPYKGKWQGNALAGADGEPFEFYLTKGTHTLSMEATTAPYQPIARGMDEVTDALRSVAASVRQASGGREDKFRVWNIEQELPGVTGSLREIGTKLGDLTERLEEINGRRSDISRALASAAKDVNELAANPENIPFDQARYGILQQSIADNRRILTQSPFELDKIVVVPADVKFPRLKARWWESAGAWFQFLFASFRDRDDYRNQSDKQLNVWMMYGRDYVNELQKLADEQFTPKYGIPVKINLIQQADLLILANAAGNAPDVALGIPADMPFDLALRNAARDLSELPGAAETFGRYHPGQLLPFAYNGGYYGLPDTMNFKVLFYRKDIMEELGIGVPDTWEDVYAALPKLRQNEYNFYVDPADYSYLFYQNGVELYDPDGLRTALNRPEGYEAFRRWTDLFNKYGIDPQVQSFYNQFRRGYSPLGIADFGQYLQLSYAAPELKGLWGIAPLPGTVSAGGAVARWAGGDALQSPSNMLFRSTPPHKSELAWEFLQWYTSTDVQTEFGRNLEQYHGEEFRWNSANIGAFSQMAWPAEDLDVIREQWKWVKGFPNVPGGYMTSRELTFAWNRTVVNGENPRTSLETAIREINRELYRKQQEFGFVDGVGNVRSSLRIPVVSEPWSGGESR